MRNTRALGLLVFAASCAAPAEQLRPTDVTARARTGEPAAAYEIRDDDRVVARVLVWSQGAYANGATYVHVAAEVLNLGDGTIALDPAALEAEVFDEHGAPIVAPAPRALPPADALEVPAASARDFDFTFVLPPGVPPAAIASLRVRGALVHGDGRRYVQFTEFTDEPPRYAGYARAFVPVFGFYDPFFRPARVLVIHHAPVRRVVVPSRPRPRHH
jgi:hypothetical protein